MAFVDRQWRGDSLHEQLAVERVVVAFHEAGHACIAEALGVTVRYATVCPRRTSRGHVAYDQAAWANASVDVLLSTLLAGPAAVQRAAYPVTIDSHAGQDIADARVLLSRRPAPYASPAVDRALCRWQARAARLVAGHWRWIAGVALDLERYGELSRDHILWQRRAATALRGVHVCRP